MKIRFDSLINVSLLLVCLLVGTNTALQLRDRLAGPMVDPSTAASPQPPFRPMNFQEGTVLPTLENVTFGSVDQTVMLVLSSKCSFCTNSMPFYKKLIEQRNGQNASLRFIAAGREPVEVMEGYLTSHGIEVDQVVSLLDNELGIQGTPTLIVADREGRVQKTFIGKLPTQAETELLSMLLPSDIASAPETRTLPSTIDGPSADHPRRTE